MAYFNRAAPNYAGHQPQSAQNCTRSLLGFWCGLFGGSPVYKEADPKAETAQPTSRCWWQAFPATPQYKTADDTKGCVPENPPPECPDDGPIVDFADDEALGW